MWWVFSALRHDPAFGQGAARNRFGVRTVDLLLEVSNLARRVLA
jgi:hypothetical protein